MVPRSIWNVLAGCLAFFAFTGDIVADSLADLRGGHCISESSDSGSHQEKAPCSHCSCAVHMGAVVVSGSVVNISGCLEPSIFFLTIERSVPPSLPATIDHPPQLA